MKKLFVLFFLCMFFISMHHVMAQDPYTRLKQTAARSTVMTKDLGNTTIPESDSRRRVESKAPIAFRSFDMVDKSGRRIDPNESINVNGKSERAKDIFEKLNEIEKDQNAKGYSVRDDKPIVINIVTPASELDGRLPENSKSIAPLKSEDELKNFSALTRQVGDVTLKPADQYNDGERRKLLGRRFLVDGSGTLSSSEPTITPAKTSKAPNAFKRDRMNSERAPNRDLTMAPETKPVNTATALKVINDVSTKDWSFGVMNTFKAGIKAELVRYAKICRFDPANPGKSMSEFKVAATATVYGGLFDHSLDLLSGGVEFFAPSDSSKPMTVKVQVRAAGITIMSQNETLTQSKTYGESTTYSATTGGPIDAHADLTIPICCGIGWSGKIGIKGNIGFSYGGAIYRTVVNVRAEPIIDLTGYCESAVSIGGVAKLGVGGELTFIQGHIPFNTLLGIWTQNADQIVVGYNYYLGYELAMLKGRLYAYADVCIPVIDKCHRLGEINLFSWGGFKSSGTIVDGGSNYVISNL